MKPFIWFGGARWFVTRPPASGWGWPFSVWRGTLANGYGTLAEAMDDTLAALASDPS